MALALVDTQLHEHWNREPRAQSDTPRVCLQALVSAKGAEQEKLFLSWLADFVSAVLVAAVVKLLSTHATGEQTLDMPNKWLQVRCASAHVPIHPLSVQLHVCIAQGSLHLSPLLPKETLFEGLSV